MPENLDEFGLFDPKERKILPVGYNFIYRRPKKVKPRGPAYFGVPVKDYQTKSFYTRGHSKPISKIINYSIFSRNENK